MFEGIYVISDDGLPLLYYDSTKQKTKANEAETLFSGLMSAILKFLREVKIGEARKFTTQSHDVFISTFDHLSIVLIKPEKNNVTDEEVNELLSILGNEVNKLLFPGTSESVEIDVNNAKTVDQMFSIVNKLVTIWEQEVTQSHSVKKMKESLW